MPEKKKYWCVRVVLHRKNPNNPTSQVRSDAFVYDDLGVGYKGLEMWLTLLEPVTKTHRNDDEGICFDITCPRTIRAEESNTWANMKADKIASFGINAIAAPEWVDR